MLESTIQSKAVKVLEKKGWVVIRLKATSVSGWPDLICLKEPNRCIFIEMKRPKGKVSPMQQMKHDLLRLMKFEVYVIDDVLQLKKIR
jgi:Holliday junction resolvase